MRSTMLCFGVLLALALAACAKSHTRRPAGAGVVCLGQGSLFGGPGHELHGSFHLADEIDDLGTSSPLRFFPASAFEDASCRLVTVSGDCRRFECSEEIMAHESISAGELAATVGGGRPITAGLDTHGLYRGSELGAAFSAGSLVTFSATGETVPAFDIDVVAPAPLDGTLPATVARSAGLTLRWSPGIAAETVFVMLEATDESNWHVAACEIPASEAAVNIAPELLSGMPPGHSWLTAGTVNQVEANTGGYAIRAAVVDMSLVASPALE
jgi:hypothetical protein